MKTVIVTGSNGLIGSECVKFYHDLGYKVVGIDDDSRFKFFGIEASTRHMKDFLNNLENFILYEVNIIDYKSLQTIAENVSDVELIIHTAAQPSHDWAATNPFEDFNTNALGTLNMLEILRNYFPDAVFIFTSTNKVYGDRPNTDIKYIETQTRYTPADATIEKYGISEDMNIDNCKHSLFGVSKAYGDLIVQEYGKYFNLKTGIFRGGCLTGENHSGVKSHGFLSYLVKCAINDDEYYINGYKGKQVRDNIHAHDVVTAFHEFFKNPKPGEVYNIGGNQLSNCSILEAIDLIEQISNKKIRFKILETERVGDHIWYITDMRKFKNDYPDWTQKYDLITIIKQMIS